LPKVTIMIRISTLLFLCSFLFLAGCSGSKQYAKKAKKLDQAGLTEEAAQFYYESLMRKRTNVDAKIGLKKTGQMVLDNQLAVYYKSHSTDDHKRAVYSYMEAQAYFNKVKSVGVNLEFPTHYESSFSESKEIYLSARYEEAVVALENEDFATAETIIREIILIDDSFGDIKDMKVLAVAEPAYRKGKQLMNQKKYRQAYYSFHGIITQFTTYKDAVALREFCREKGSYTVAFLPFENTSGKSGLEHAIAAQIINELLSLNDPFLRIIDRQHLETLLQEQKLGLSGIVDESTAVNAGNLIGAQAVFTGKLITFRMNQGNLQQETRRGYHSYTVKKNDPVTGKVVTETQYKKVTYNVFNQANSVAASFQYKLISTETGEILLADLLNYIEEDKVNYGRYEDNYRYLYPGTWKDPKRESPEDKIFTAPSEKKSLNALFESRTEVKSVETLTTIIYQKIGNEVGRKVKAFNPEK
jgi:hypothetical protein